MTDSPHEHRAAALGDMTPRFALSVGYIGEHAAVVEPRTREHCRKFTAAASPTGEGPSTRRLIFAPDALFDCVLIEESAEALLGNPGRLADVLAHLTSAGVLIALLPVRCAEDAAGPLFASITRAGLVVVREAGVDDAWAAYAFVRKSYDPIVHARQLAGAGMPGRAVAVLDWLDEGPPLSREARAGLALEKLRFFRAAVERSTPLPSHKLLFHAQKEFHLAVHEWPARPGPYLDQAAIWRRFGNDDYAARLLRSVYHVTKVSAVGEALAACRPETTRQPWAETLPEWTGNAPAPRVLVLTHDASDYGMDTLYDGLCQVLGADNVVEFPWKPTLHGQNREATLNYPCWFDYPGAPRSVDELVRELRDGRYGLIVFADFVQMNMQDTVRRLLDAAPDVPVVAYDPWDDGSATQDQARDYLGGRPLAAYFKREMLACLDYGPNAYPLPFGYPDRHVPAAVPARGTTDLFWAGKRLFGTRSLYLDRLRETMGRPLDRTMSQEEYRTAIAGARLGLSFFGFGFDTVRYWELAAHGCMVLAERPLVRIPFNFVEGESAAFFDDLPELERKLAHYLAHPDVAERIGRAGREVFLRYHTSSARARQFLGVIKSVLLWDRKP